MLYMIQAWGEDNKTAVKIGFTDNLEDRLFSYRVCNPFVKVLGTKEGTEEDEKKIHLYLTHKKHKQDFLNEWFDDSEEVLGVFSLGIEEIDEYLWENRSEIWSSGDILSNGIKFKIFSDLWETHQEDLSFLDPLNKSYQNKLYSLDSPLDKFLDDIEDDEMRKFLFEFHSTGIFEKKLEAYCKFSDLHSSEPEVLKIFNAKVRDPKYQTMYSFFGTKGCKAKKFRELALLKSLGDSTKEEMIRSEVFSAFEKGKVYSLKDVKKILQGIYDKLSLSKNAKATDIKEYFQVEELKITNKSTKKREYFYKLAEKAS